MPSTVLVYVIEAKKELFSLSAARAHPTSVNLVERVLRLPAVPPVSLPGILDAGFAYVVANGGVRGVLSTPHANPLDLQGATPTSTGRILFRAAVLVIGGHALFAPRVRLSAPAVELGYGLRDAAQTTALDRGVLVAAGLLEHATAGIEDLVSQRPVEEGAVLLAGRCGGFGKGGVVGCWAGHDALGLLLALGFPAPEGLRGRAGSGRAHCARRDPIP